MDLIKGEFPTALVSDGMAADEVAMARAMERGAPILGNGMEGVVRGGGAPCKLRIEDAAVSIRFALRNEVFTQGHKLSEERLGELACGTMAVLCCEELPD